MRCHDHTFDPTDPTRFEEMYRDERVTHGLPAATPWDIGGPQPVVQQLVALGAIKGEVLDPGTGPGHHAIYYASQGFSATGIDGSAAAIERARENAAQGRGIGGFPGGRRHQAGRPGRPVRHRRGLRVLPHLQHRTRAAEVLRAGAAPGHSSRGRGCTCSSSVSTTSTASRCCGRCLEDDFRQVLPRRRLGDHLSGARPPTRSTSAPSRSR